MRPFFYLAGFKHLTFVVSVGWIYFESFLAKDVSRGMHRAMEGAGVFLRNAVFFSNPGF